MTSSSAVQNSYPHRNEPLWPSSEKTIARKAFDAALAQELHQVIQEAKRMANEIKPQSSVFPPVAFSNFNFRLPTKRAKSVRILCHAYGL